MKKVLISTLGLAPGVVTGAYFALEREGELMDEVVTVTTGSPVAKLCENMVDDALQQANFDIVYKRERPTTRDTLQSLDDVTKFVRCIDHLLEHYMREEFDIFVNVSGGRKSMVAAAVLAAQKTALYKEPDELRMRMFHVEVDDDIEARGNISTLIGVAPQECDLYLNPPPEKVNLVDITTLALEKPPTAEWSNLYEFAVGEYLSKEGDYWVRTNFDPPYLRNQPGLGEVDIFAAPRKDGAYLVVECKLRTVDDPDDKPIRVQEVRQLVNKMAPVAEEEGVTVEGRLYSNTGTVDIDAWELARRHGIQLWIAKPPTGWKKGKTWKIGDAELIEEVI